MGCAIINCWSRQKTNQTDREQLNSQGCYQKALATMFFAISIILIIIGALLLSFFPITLFHTICSTLVIGGGIITAVLGRTLLYKYLFSKISPTLLKEEKI